MEKPLIQQQSNSLELYSDNLDAKLKFCATLLKGGLVPQHFKTPEAVLTAVLYGKEVGFSPLRALHMITVIQGKATIDASGLKALAIERGAKIETVAWTDALCTLRCTRDKWTEEFSFSIKDAERMGLTTRDNWKRMPKQMLYARTVSTLVRNMFADVIGGLYSREEMQDSLPAAAETPLPKSVADDKPFEEDEQKQEKATWLYGLSEYAQSAGEKWPSIKARLEKKGCVCLDHSQLWRCPIEIPNLARYEVEPESVDEEKGAA